MISLLSRGTSFRFRRLPDDDDLLMFVVLLAVATQATVDANARRKIVDAAMIAFWLEVADFDCCFDVVVVDDASAMLTMLPVSSSMMKTGGCCWMMLEVDIVMNKLFSCVWV